MTTELGQAFIDDHRHMMQCLNRLLQALEASDLSIAVEPGREFSYRDSVDWSVAGRRRKRRLFAHR